MANTLYDSARALFAKGEIDWESDTIHCFLVNATYTFSVSHSKLTAIDGSADGPRDYGTAVAAGIALTNKGVQTNGAIFADSVRFVTCAAGRPAVTAIVLARIGVDDANSDLIYYADVATGLPITPNGGDIIVTWSTGTNRILRL
jgi:hypothetical protein